MGNSDSCDTSISSDLISVNSDFEQDSYLRDELTTETVYVGYHKSKTLIRIYKKDVGYITMDINSLTTLLYLLTPFLSMMEMGIVSYIADLMPKMHLGEDVWLELYPPLDTCIIRNKVGTLVLNMDQLTTLYRDLFKPGHVAGSNGILGSRNLPCMFSHNTIEGIARCKVCGGCSWFNSK
jgi:hypothetical protein